MNKFCIALFAVCFAALLPFGFGHCCPKYMSPFECDSTGPCNIFCCNCAGHCLYLAPPGKGLWKRSTYSSNNKFEQIDQNHDGVISYEEANIALIQYGSNQTAFIASDRKWFEQMDANHDGFIQRQEFD